MEDENERIANKIQTEWEQGERKRRGGEEGGPGKRKERKRKGEEEIDTRRGEGKGVEGKECPAEARGIRAACEKKT